jgi:hypothetical protein
MPLRPQGTKDPGVGKDEPHAVVSDGPGQKLPDTGRKNVQAVHTGSWSASAAHGHVPESAALDFWPMRRDTLYFCLIWLTAVGGTMIVGFLIR